VVVSVSGGASAAALWTGYVLAELEGNVASPFKGLKFHDHVRLMTGASGGMIGSALYVQRIDDQNGTDDQNEIDKNYLKILEQDSLTPVIRELVVGDLLWGFAPFQPFPADRGQALEWSWKELRGKTFARLRKKEKQGEVPSIVFSPMIVEDGRRLLISNLDLEKLVHTKLQAPGKKEPGELISISAVEFFKLFKDSQPDVLNAFTLATAARMNSTFPYVSPAVCLPTSPPIRIVDAGYYDNFGIQLAAKWMFENQDWLKSETSGIALVQIRAYDGRDARLKGPTPERILTTRNLLTRGLDFLTSPIDAGLAAYNSSMAFRNDESIEALDRSFNSDGPVFVTFSFEGPFKEITPSWYLTLREKLHLRSGFNSKPFEKADASADPGVEGGNLSSMHTEVELKRIREAISRNQSNRDRLREWLKP
jgi:hypothetical protein